MSKYATVEALWPGATVVCIGGGPSLTKADVEFVRGKARVIAVNDAYKLAPWADVLYGCDGKWWNWHKGVPSFIGLKYCMTYDKNIKWPGVARLRNDGPRELCLQRDGLRNGRNSGYQAINLAVLLGATRIILLGYDMKPAGRKNHWFGEHPRSASSLPYRDWLAAFSSLPKPLQQLGVEVINCSRDTALTTFPRRPLEVVLDPNEGRRRRAAFELDPYLLLEALRLPTDTDIQAVRLDDAGRLVLTVEHPGLLEQPYGQVGEATPLLHKHEDGRVSFEGWGQAVPA